VTVFKSSTDMKNSEVNERAPVVFNSQEALQLGSKYRIFSQDIGRVSIRLTSLKIGKILLE